MFFTINLAQDQSSHSPYLSNTLIDEIEKTLQKGEKTLLYLNKRGAFSSMVCQDCHYLFECPNCDISLSVHHNPEHFLCHLCQHAFNIPASCPKCSGNTLKSVGIGTQQLESIMKTIFPEQSVFRFDSDSMKSLSSKKQALASLESADIIIGTKMLTTGFNFEKIGCIGVILIEGELSFPHYDQLERAYSNLKQLIGRGNRKSQNTNIILQSFIPKNALIEQLVDANFQDFLYHNLTERKDFLYPPFQEMVQLEYRDKNASRALEYIENLTSSLEQYNREGVYHFLKATSSFRKNNLHHVSLIIKGTDIQALLEHIRDIILRDSHLSLIYHSHPSKKSF